MNEDIATRVARGVALLDERVPGWVNLVNPLGLNIESTEQCVLGQIYGQYNEGVDALDINPERYGFDANHFDGNKWQYAVLTKEWTRVITILRQKQASIEQEPCTADAVSVA